MRKAALHHKNGMDERSSEINHLTLIPFQKAANIFISKKLQHFFESKSSNTPPLFQIEGCDFNE